MDDAELIELDPVIGEPRSPPPSAIPHPDSALAGDVRERPTHTSPSRLGLGATTRLSSSCTVLPQLDETRSSALQPVVAVRDHAESRWQHTGNRTTTTSSSTSCDRVPRTQTQTTLQMAVEGLEFGDGKAARRKSQPLLRKTISTSTVQDKKVRG